MSVSLLLWGFRATGIETVKAKLESELDVAFDVSRDDDTGIHYVSSSPDPPSLELFPNLEFDEDGEYFAIEKFSEHPVILAVTAFEARPGLIQEIKSISGIDAELLERDDVGT